MTNENSPNLFNFLLLVSFVYSIAAHCKVSSAYNDKPRKFVAKSRLRNNTVETPETVITAVITMPGEKIVNSELNNLKNLTGLNFKFREKLHAQTPPEIRRRNIFQRKIRNTLNKTSKLDDLECLFCLGSGFSVKDEDCYRGEPATTEKCTYGQECHVELRTQFIKRGCITRNRLNRTFVCKCPLCNDKSSDDFSYYSYNKVKDWEYDNKFLGKPLIGTELICKVCETKGTNLASDRTCRIGKYADYMVCGQSQVCYVNIDDETNFVSRGCTDKPANNSFYEFCNKTLCNSDAFENPNAPRLRQLTLTHPFVVRSKGFAIHSISATFLRFILYHKLFTYI